VVEKRECYELVLHEKEELIPGSLEGKSVVLDSFCNPLNILTRSFSLKRIYLIIKCRRWKEAGSDNHYSNDYDLQAERIKMTRVCQKSEFINFTLVTAAVNGVKLSKNRVGKGNLTLSLSRNRT
jgi:hypothetical protein